MKEVKEGLGASIGRSVSGRRNSRCKAPEAGKCQACWSFCEESGVGEQEWLIQRWESERRGPLQGLGFYFG